MITDTMKLKTNTRKTYPTVESPTKQRMIKSTREGATMQRQRSPQKWREFKCHLVKSFMQCQSKKDMSQWKMIAEVRTFINMMVTWKKVIKM